MIERVPKLFLQILQNRIELSSLELQEEKLRVKRQIVAAAAGAILGVTGLVGLVILAIYLVPIPDRTLLASLVIAVFIVLAVVLLLVAKADLQRSTFLMLASPVFRVVQATEIGVSPRGPARRSCVASGSDLNSDNDTPIRTP